MTDSILYWNGVALEANRESHTHDHMEQTGPPLSARALAIVHLAMYDAFVGADAASGGGGTDPHYLPAAQLPTATAGASPDAAIASAAYTTLSALFPSQIPTFDLFATFFRANNLPGTATTDSVRDGYAYGEAVAQALLNRRKDDPGASPVGYTVKHESGKWRPDPDNPKQQAHAPHYGRLSTLFATTTRYTLVEPPAVTTASGEYLRAFRQVKGKGIAPDRMDSIPAGSRRRLDEAVAGIYWGYDGRPLLGTPPRLYNRIVRQLAKVKNNTLAENAKLFALLNTAMADAGILAWEQKYVHDYWRPVTGIREHGGSLGAEEEPGNPISGDADPWWLPLGAPLTNALGKNFSPPFPAYPSGHATFGAAAFHVARRFFGVDEGDTSRDDLFQDASGQDMPFVSEEFNGVNLDNTGTVRPLHARDFKDGLWEMIIENSRSRVFLGVHWIFDGFAVDPQNNELLDKDVDLANGVAGVGGVPLGLAIADDIYENGLLADNGAGPAVVAADAFALASAADTIDLARLTREAPRQPWPLG